jgi:hypothetical protein
MRRFLLVVAVAATVSTIAAATAAAALPPGAWGGPTTATDGETVTVGFSPSYPQDPAVQQQWADFMTTLVHGPELATITVVLEPLRQVQFVCGRSALACYLGGDKTLYAPGEDVPGEATAKSIVAHEYGHHVANSGTNAPWSALDWGTKRWATAMGVCSKVRSGQLFPGDEGRNYLFNPGEAFAESYRLLNEQALGLTPTAWSIVDPSLQPSLTALDALREDIATPWTGPTLVTRTGTFAKTAKATTKTFTIPTPLDGTLVAAVKSPRTGVYRAQAATTTVCGQRTVAVTVTRVKGYGPYTLTVSTP